MYYIYYIYILDIPYNHDITIIFPITIKISTMMYGVGVVKAFPCNYNIPNMIIRNIQSANIVNQCSESLYVYIHVSAV